MQPDGSGISSRLFTGSTRRRPVINLGGSSGQANILERARAERREREEQRRRQNASLKIQVSL
jgi:hypothetical protein